MADGLLLLSHMLNCQVSEQTASDWGLFSTAYHRSLSLTAYLHLAAGHPAIMHFSKKVKLIFIGIGGSIVVASIIKLLRNG